MKNQMNSKLAFNKNVLVELNDQQLAGTDSGGTPATLIASSKFCAGVVIGGILWLISD